MTSIFLPLNAPSYIRNVEILCSYKPYATAIKFQVIQLTSRFQEYMQNKSHLNENQIYTLSLLFFEYITKENTVFLVKNQNTISGLLLLASYDILMIRYCFTAYCCN